MKAIAQSRILKETLTFTGLMGVALLASLLIGDVAFAGGLISPDDNFVGDATNNEGDLKAIVKTILNFFLGFLGFVATIMVMYGGLLYVTGGNNDESIAKAKKIIMYAVVGILIILVSFALINTILGAATGGAIGA